jgi:hypothetical protein
MIENHPSFQDATPPLIVTYTHRGHGTRIEID